MSPRRWSTARMAIGVLVAMLAMLLVPVHGFASFEDPGKHGVQLDVTPSDDLPQVSTVQVTGRGFVANDVAQIAECPAHFTFAPTDCQSIGTTPTDANGTFSTAAQVTAATVNCADAAGNEKCQVVAITYASNTAETSRGTHHICFASASGPPANPCSGPPPGVRPSNTTRPSFSGPNDPPQEGDMLKGDRGAWSGSNLSYSYLWIQCEADGTHCGGAGGNSTSLDYTLSSDSVGRRFKLRVTASNSAGSASAESELSGVVSARVPPPVAAAPCTLRERAVWHPFTGYPSFTGGTVGHQSTVAADVLWKQESPPESPSAREGAAMGYDAVHKQTVLFGGFVRGAGGGCVLADTWTWDGSSWTQRHPDHNPPARYGHAMAGDQNGVLLFGGYDGLKDLGDTWTWDGSDWREHGNLSKAPSPRARTAMGYDADHRRTVLFGGDHDAKSLDDTWTWDGGAWTKPVPAESPPARGYATMAYHAATKQVVLQAGWDGHTMQDTWVWDGVTWTLANNYYGPALHSGAMAYHPATGLDIFQSGSNQADLTAAPFDPSANGRGQTTAWDGSGWAASSSPQFSPPARAFPAMAEDAAGQVVFFGGYGQLAGPTGDAGGDNADRGDTWTLFTPGAGTTPSPDEQVKVKLEPAEIDANGTSTSTATATVTLGGVRLAGRQVTFSTNGDVTFSKATGVTDASGTFTTTITASRTPDSETITATASLPGGDPVHPGQGTRGSAVLVERGLTLTLNPSWVPPDGSSTSQATATLSHAGDLGLSCHGCR